MSKFVLYLNWFYFSVYLQFLWKFKRRLKQTEVLDVWEKNSSERLYGKKDHKPEAGANELSGQTKFKVRAPPEWN
jgi:hypothetical protein